MHDNPEADFALDVGRSYRLTADDTWSAASSTGPGDALDGRQGVFRQSGDPPPQGIVGDTGRLPLGGRSPLLAHYGPATDLVINERHTGTLRSWSRPSWPPC